MENMFKQSRTIINNPVYEKYEQQRYLNHKKAVEKMRSYQSCYNQASQSHFQTLTHSKEAHKKVSEIFNPSSLENKALVRRLVQVEMKQNRVKGFYSMYRIGQKSPHEKEKIKQENQLLKKKIKEQKKKILSIKALKQQFRKHDRNLQLSRKFKPQKKF